MKISLRWLNDYVDLCDIDINQLCEKIRLHSCEIDSIEPTFSYLDHLQWAQIQSIQKHPHADRLSVCQIQPVRILFNKGKNSNTSQLHFKKEKSLTIICGATNLTIGMISIVAPAGVTIAADVKIKKAKIRGVASEGMLCAWEEIGLANFSAQKDAIIEIQQEELIAAIKCCNLENPFRKQDPKHYLVSDFIPGQDWILEVDNKSITHRPDMWSHFGFARELAAILNRPLKYNPLLKPKKFIKTHSIVPSKKKLTNTKKIHTQENTVHAYYGATFNNLHICSSPLWVQVRLINLGHNPVNNAVDATNYILLDIGQPCHAFSHEKLSGDTISVGLSQKTSSLTTLDKITRKIPKQTLMIYNQNGSSQQMNNQHAVAIAGIMGGLQSAISENTTHIFLESAVFVRGHIRRSMTALNLRTDASRVFEKGQDPFQAKPAISRFYHLMRFTCPKIQMSQIQGFAKIKRNRIRITLSFLQKKLGIIINEKEVKDILNRLAMQVLVKPTTSTQKTKDREFHIQIPSHRSQYDLTIADDIVEEVGRILSYAEIMRRAKIQTLPAHKRNFPSIHPNLERNLQNTCKNFFAQVGHFREIYSYPFVDQKSNSLLTMDSQVSRPAIALRNPVDQNRPYLKTQLFSGLIEAVVANRNQSERLRFFEFGRSFHHWDSQDTTSTIQNNRSPCCEIKRLGWIDYCSAAVNETTSQLETHLIESRILLWKFFHQFNIDIRFQKSTSQNLFHPKAGLEILLSDSRNHDSENPTKPVVIGNFGLLHPKLLREYTKLTHDRIITGEINISRLFLHLHNDPDRYREGEFYFENNHSLSIHHHYQTPSVFPSLSFEIALIIPKDLDTSIPAKIIYDLKIREIEKVHFLDSYSGSPLPEDKKSVSYRISCLSHNRTLEQKDLQKIIGKINDQCRAHALILRDK